MVSPLLKSVAGVNEVNSFGGYSKQFQVWVATDRKNYLNTVCAYPMMCITALQNNNENVGGNVIEHNSEQYIVRGIGMIRSEEDIKSIVLKSENGIPVLHP